MGRRDQLDPGHHGGREADSPNVKVVATGEDLRHSESPLLVGPGLRLVESDGEQTVRLELIPKSADMKRSVPKLEMWVSTRTWQPVRQKLYQSSQGDYRIYAYSKIQVNPSLKSSDFKLKTSGKVNRIRPQ